MKRSRKLLSAIVAATTAFCLALACYGARVTVVSSNSTPGRWHWFFTKGDENTIWGLEGSIRIQSYGVQQVYSPTGWSYTNDGGFITWTPTNGTVFIHNAAIEFGVQSAFTNSVTYTNNPGLFFPRGWLSGWLYTTNYTPLGVPGTEEFVITGPQPRPNFSAFSISNSQAVFSIEEMMGLTCHVEIATNLVSNVWQKITNFTVEGLSTNLTDQLPAMTSPLFYRLRFTR